MIFISYRREDTKAEVTNLHGRLVERFGEEQVFVDYKNIPFGEAWPDAIRERLEQSRVLLAVVGPGWGEARFPPGTKRWANRMRLDHPDDWVRQEVCAALRRGRDEILVIPVLVDDAELPETWWDCELDQLPGLQHARLRNQKEFETTFDELCARLEEAVPELRRAAASRRGGHAREHPPAADAAARALGQYLDAELRSYDSIQLPLISPAGRPVVARIDELRIDLPLILTHARDPAGAHAGHRWLGSDVLAVNDELRHSHTNLLLVDRASRHEDVSRDFDLAAGLGPHSRLVIVGDPGCGKSTLLQWVAHCYGSRFASGAHDGGARARGEQVLPAHDWLPLLVPCRDLAGHPLPASLDDLLRLHLKARQFSDAAAAALIPHFERLLEDGRALLLVDGLDEIDRAERRADFCKLLNSAANRFPEVPVLITSRVVGFQAVRDELAAKFDHLHVGPLDRAAKGAFIERWLRLIGWGPDSAASLVRQVCHSRVAAKLTDNIFMLAMVAQIKVLDRELPTRRLDVYRRAVQLMIERRRPFAGPQLSVNEVIPHLEFLAYRMRRRGVQRFGELEVEGAFRELRELEPDEPALRVRAPGELLRACIDSLGLLNVAGTETDRRGFDRLLIQFFHQSFQEYFAGQAINHGHDGAGARGPVERVRELLADIETREQEVVIAGGYKIVEPVLADYWQEALRLSIAGMKPDEADDAMLMLLPDLGTPRPEARARAVFALQCLADEPPVSERTVAAVFDAALDWLETGDGVSSNLNTWMDEALAAVSESAFGPRLRRRLLEGFIQAGGELRHLIGGCAAHHTSAEPVTAADAEETVAAAARGLSSGEQAERVHTALELVNRFFLMNGKLGFLTPGQQETLLEALVSALGRDEATDCAVMWALLWLTNGKNLGRGKTPKSEFVYLDAPRARRVESFLRRPGVEPITLSFGCLVLTKEEGLTPVSDQLDWVLEMAKVADGAQGRRSLPEPAPSGRTAPVDWIEELLGAGIPAEYSCRFAMTLGAFGVYVPAMVEPLWHVFSNPKYSAEERDEALVYLGLIGTPEVVSRLVEAADVSMEADDFLNLRGLCGLILIDDVDVLAGQLGKDLPHADLDAYAFALASSRDPRGRALLEEFKDHPEARVRGAVAKALGRSWPPEGL